jgi:hypothetical protein
MAYWGLHFRRHCVCFIQLFREYMKKLFIPIFIPILLFVLSPVAYASNSYCATGFIPTSFNGVYTDTGQTQNGQPMYQNIDAKWLYQTNSDPYAWLLSNANYYNFNGAAFNELDPINNPDSSTWVANGDGTAGSIVLGDCTPPAPPASSGGVLFGHSGESKDIVSGGGGSALAAVGMVSTNAFNSIFPYLMLSAGVFLGFYLIQKIVIMLNLGGEKAKKKK